MTSERRIEANRRNALKSTAPRTQEGKNKVRFNAVTHGLTAKIFVLPGEDEDEFQRLLDAFTDDLRPCGPAEACLVEQVALTQIQLTRVLRHEQKQLVRRSRE